MKDFVKIILLVIAGIFAFNIALKLLTGIIALALKILIPVVIVGGILYVVYSMGDKKPLGFGKKRYLP